ACTFDPGELQCGTDKNPTCLSPVQVKAVRDLYTGHQTKAGVTSAYGLSRGGEAAWPVYISATKKPDPASFLAGGTSVQGLGSLRAQLFGDPEFDLTKFNFDKDYAILKGSAFAAEYE